MDRTDPAEIGPQTRRVLERIPSRARRPIELVVRTAVDARDDRVVGLAAEVAFFAILSLPPLLLTIVAALGFLPGNQEGEFVSALIRASQQIFSPDTVQDVISPTVQALVGETRPDVVSIGFALSLVSASRAVWVVLVAVSIAYDLDSYRPNWRQRVYALLLTLGLFVVVPIVIPLLLAGPDFGRMLASSEVVPTPIASAWPLLYWLGVGVLGVTSISALYNLAAPWWTPFRRDLPGAVLAIAIWVASSAGLQLYTTNAISGDGIYAILGGPLALLVWLYLLAFGVLIGGELNAELERMYPSPEHLRVPPTDRLRRLWSARDDDASARAERDDDRSGRADRDEPDEQHDRRGGDGRQDEDDEGTVATTAGREGPVDGGRQ